jgi:hypothetical protein
MWEPIDGANLCGVNRKILRRSSNPKIMFYGFPNEKNTSGQIQEKMV